MAWNSTRCSMSCSGVARCVHNRHPSSALEAWPYLTFPLASSAASQTEDRLEPLLTSVQSLLIVLPHICHHGTLAFLPSPRVFLHPERSRPCNACPCTHQSSSSRSPLAVAPNESLPRILRIFARMVTLYAALGGQVPESSVAATPQRRMRSSSSSSARTYDSVASSQRGAASPVGESHSSSVVATVTVESTIYNRQEAIDAAYTCCVDLFHGVYGLFPGPFVSFLRDLHGDDVVVRHFSVGLFATVALHPHLILNASAAAERWRSMEPLEVMAECDMLRRNVRLLPNDKPNAVGSGESLAATARSRTGSRGDRPYVPRPERSHHHGRDGTSLCGECRTPFPS